MRVEDIRAFKYAQSVLSGDTIACKLVIKACERFMSDLENPKFYLDLDEVERVTSFFENILHVPELKRSEPLQPPHAFWIQQIYGWKMADTGLRRINTAYLQFARKSFKTFYAAGLSLCETLLGNDDSPFIMQGANTRDQAMICTNMTGKIIMASPELKGLVNLKKGIASEDKPISLFAYKKLYNRIVYEDDTRFAEIQAMPKDPGDGGNASVGIIDEFHEANSSDLLETIESGQGQRAEPLTVIITSPGHNKTGPCYANARKKSVDVLNGVVEDDHHLSLIFELDSEAEYQEIANDLKLDNPTGLSRLLEKSNPMIPYSSTLLPYLKKRIRKANIEGGATAVNIKIKNAGLWVDAASVWIPSDTIKRNSHGSEYTELIGKRCFSGLDLSAGMDLNSYVQFFPDFKEIEVQVPRINENGNQTLVCEKVSVHAVKAMFWIPKHKLVNAKNDGVDYQKYVDDGWIKVFDGNTVDYDLIAEDIIEETRKHDTVVFGADPKYLTTGVASYLNSAGLIEPRGDYQGLVPVAQGFNLTAATGQIEIWAANSQLELFGNPVMEMCFANTTLHYKDMVATEGGLSGHKYPSKGKSNGRIDGVSGLCTAGCEYLRLGLEPPKTQSFIEAW